MSQATTSDLLPEGWIAQLQTAGYYACNLAELVGGPEAVTDAVLLQVAAPLAALAPALSCAPIMHIREVPGSRYAALSKGVVPLHNDHIYFYKPPNYVLFYCDDPGEGGGDTLVVRGDEAYRRLSLELREGLERLRVRVRQGDCCVTRTLVATHPLDGTKVLLFSDPVAHVNCTMEVDGKPLDETLLESLRAVFASVGTYRQRWRTGDLLLMDNFKVLHAREAYQGTRMLRRMSVGSHASRS